MPQSKDDAPVTSADKKVHLQKRLILCEINKGYLSYEELNPEADRLFTVCILTFKKTVLVGRHGKHAVCVCTIHQNVKLMVSGEKLYDLAENKITIYDCP
jgi:hypothetical protein